MLGYHIGRRFDDPELLLSSVLRFKPSHSNNSFRRLGAGRSYKAAKPMVGRKLTLLLLSANL